MSLASAARPGTAVHIPSLIITTSPSSRWTHLFLEKLQRLKAHYPKFHVQTFTSHTFITVGHSPMWTTIMTIMIIQITMAFEVCSPLKILLYELNGFVKWVEISDILFQETATAVFHKSKERFDPPKCHPNTHLAVVERVMKWIKYTGRNFWCIYYMGVSGKSAIAQTIAEICEQEMILLASFFFSRNDPSRSTANPLIATIAYQITLNLPDVRNVVLEAIERDPLIFSKSLAVQVKSPIVTPLQPLTGAGFFNGPTFGISLLSIVLMNALSARLSETSWKFLQTPSDNIGSDLFFFLFASRPEQHISLAFSTGIA